MRILLLTHGFNSLTQRLHVELRERGHTVAVEFDINDDATREAVALFRPDLVLAPFLKRAIPDDVWRRNVCLVLHPGPQGDRGPCALDWAILGGESSWGITVLQAVKEMDAGPVWYTEDFPMRPVRKSSLYRHQVSEAGVRGLLTAVDRFAEGSGPIATENTAPERGWQSAVRQADRRIDWEADDTETVLRKLRSGDGNPGVEELIDGRAIRWYGGWTAEGLGGAPGEFLVRRGGAVCRATRDGAVWITHAQPVLTHQPTFKLPAIRVLGSRGAALPEAPLHFSEPVSDGLQPIRYVEDGPVGLLYFDFYNGAMGTDLCRELLTAYRWALDRPTRVIALMGGEDFWSNGLDLNAIEAADSPADESWNNIVAMDDLAEAILTTQDRLTIAALRGNAGAGGVFLALTADEVVARQGIILNPHYKSMGNLYGSEYWTYTLPRRVAIDHARHITQNRLPVGTREALRIGLVDSVVDATGASFESEIRDLAATLASDAAFEQALEDKRLRRQRDEAVKPLAAYREEELERMRLNFYGFDPSYHVARYRFVHKEPKAWTPLYLAPHRRSPGRTEQAI